MEKIKINLIFQLIFLLQILLLQSVGVAQTLNYQNEQLAKNKPGNSGTSGRAPADILLRDIKKSLDENTKRYENIKQPLPEVFKFDKWYVSVASKEINEKFPGMASCNPTQDDLNNYKKFLTVIKNDLNSNSILCSKIHNSFVQKFGDKRDEAWERCKQVVGQSLYQIQDSIRDVEINCKNKLQIKKNEEERARLAEEAEKQIKIQQQNESKRMEDPIYRERKQKIKSCYSICQAKLEECAIRYSSSANQICGMSNSICFQGCDSMK